MYTTESLPTQGLAHDLGGVALLIVAVAIDFFDLLPLDLVGLGLLYELPLAAIETMLLMHVGAPPRNALLVGGLDLVPFVDWIPWSTLAVLDRRFGVQIPLVSRFLNP
jgi:hypothetical protein